MKEKLVWIRDKIIDAKIYIGRTMGWISMANNLMLVFLVIERLSSLGIIKANISDFFILVVGVWFFVLLILGWVEVNKIKAIQTESTKMVQLNPPMREAYKKIDKMDIKIDKIEEQLIMLNRKKGDKK